MKKLKTVSEIEILTAAWTYYTELWNENREKNCDCEKIVGHKNDLYSEREKKYWSIREEIGNLILEMKNKNLKCKKYADVQKNGCMSAFSLFFCISKTYLISLNFNFAKLEEI